MTTQSGPRGLHDNRLFFAICALVCLGVVMVYSTSYARDSRMGADPEATLVRQLIAVALGMVTLVAFSLIPTHVFRFAAGFGMLGALALLVAVLVPGVAVEGSTDRWIPIPFGLTLQPSVIAGVALVLFLASLGARYAENPPSYEAFLILGLGVTYLTCTFVVKEPNLSSAVLIGVTGFAVLLVAGAQVRHLRFALISGFSAALIVALSVPYMRQRLIDFIAGAQGDAAHQVKHCLIALGSGGFLGRGLGKGIEKYGYLPEVYNDTIFAAIGEELGFAMTLAVVVLYALVLIRGYRIATLARTPYARYLAFGLTTLLALEAAINMLVVTGLLPPTGLPLPFVSAGGSSMAVLLGAGGMLLSASRECAEVESEVSPAHARGAVKRRNRRTHLSRPRHSSVA